MKKTHSKGPKNIIGQKVKSLRLSQRVLVSQQDLAGRLAALGVTIDRSAIARIEKGQRYVLDYEVAAIAKSFRVPVTSLFA